MMRNNRFWISMIVFQVAFGLTVFAVTRQYYVHEADTVPANPTATRQTAPQWPEASEQSELENLISNFPGPGVVTDPVDLSLRADEAFTSGQYGEAAKMYDQLLTLDPNNADTYNNLGLTLHYLGRSSDALLVLNDGVVADPSYQRIWLTLGYVSSQVGNTGEARAALTEAVNLGPDSVVGQSAQKMLDDLGQP